MGKLTVWLGKVSLANWISFAALVVTVVLAIWVSISTSTQNSRIERLQMETNALTFRPHLRVKQPIRMTFRPENPTFEPAAFSDTSTFGFNLVLSCTVMVVNESSIPARLVSSACTDTLTGHPVLRNLVRTLVDEKHAIGFEESDEFYVDWYLQPGDSMAVPFEHTLERPEEESFTLHLLFLYENESHHLYDTYYWARYALHEPILKPRVTGDIRHFRIETAFAWQDVLTLVDKRETENVYSPEETKAFRRAIDAEE